MEKTKLEKENDKNAIALFKFAIIAPLVNNNYDYKSKEEFYRIAALKKYTLPNGISVANYLLESFIDIVPGIYEKVFDIDMSGIMFGKYNLSFVFLYTLVNRSCETLESIHEAVPIEISDETSSMYWDSQGWGSICLNGIKIIE